MNDLEQTHSNSSGDDAIPENDTALKRERHSWPFWVALVLALVALAFYTLTGELGGFFPRQPRQPVATAIGK